MGIIHPSLVSDLQYLNEEDKLIAAYQHVIRKITKADTDFANGIAAFAASILQSTNDLEE